MNATDLITEMAPVFALAGDGFAEFAKTAAPNSASGYYSKSASSGYYSKSASGGDSSTAASSGHSSTAECPVVAA
jgi:hypothetical protein